MKRGFLTTPRAKRAIDEAYAPSSPPKPESSRKGKAPMYSGSTSKARGKAATVEGTTDEEMDTARDGATAKERTKDAEDGRESIDSDEVHMEMLPDGTKMMRLPSRRPPPGPPGWGYSPKEAPLHAVPHTHGGPHRRRAIFCHWRRQPGGPVLPPSTAPRGTLSPDGYPWGATLYDFFTVNRVPSMGCLVLTTMSGSALLEAMAEMGELDSGVAQDKVAWAKSEGKPRLVPIAETKELIACADERVRMGMYDTLSMREDVRKTASGVWTHTLGPGWAANTEERAEERGEKGEEEDIQKGCDEEKDDKARDEETLEHGDEVRDGNETIRKEEKQYGPDDVGVDPATIPPPPTIPVTSPFHPSRYPPPWPFIPFENPHPICLQERIPFYLFPQKLHVHDPFNLLSTEERTFRNALWRFQRDIVRTYDLVLSKAAREKARDARQKAEELEEFKARTLIVMRYKQTKEQIKNHEPIIEVPLPPYPRQMTKLEEAHLYLSPVAKVGDGNHSVVYNGEWELPRDLFVRPKLCQACFEESAEKEVRRLKDTGRYEKMMKVLGWGPTGWTGCEPTQAELDEVNDMPKLENDGEIIEREIICVVPPKMPPSHVLQFIEHNDVFDTFMGHRDQSTLLLDIAQSGKKDDSTDESHLAGLRINPPFSYDHIKTCTHGSPNDPLPRTAKFTVVAKLSLPDDPHLANEARNYQEFPERFFENYDGYTLISQLHALVPVNAIVPQFYGYYRPSARKAWQPYLSPILLLEHCGEPIDPEALSEEDQEECASMLLRFQRAGWIHESVAPRNFVVQVGKPTEFPLKRQANPELSFRLIDFGRSRKYVELSQKQEEEGMTLKMFEKLQGKMGRTF